MNHLRSLNGIDEPGATNGDRVRSKRNDQAKYLANLINGTSGDQGTNWNLTDNLVVVGDFNAFYVNDGYADMMNCITGNPAPANQQFFTAAQLAVGSPCTPILNPPLTNLTNARPGGLLFLLVRRNHSNPGSRSTEHESVQPLPPACVRTQ